MTENMKNVRDLVTVIGTFMVTRALLSILVAARQTRGRPIQALTLQAPIGHGQCGDYSDRSSKRHIGLVFGTLYARGRNLWPLIRAGFRRGHQ